MDDEFDDLFDDGLEEPIKQQEEPTQEPSQEEDLTSEILRLRGIKDSEKIKFENEEGVVEERSWSDLDKEEKINILLGSDEQSNQENDLDDSEIDLINAIRLSGLSVEDYMAQLQKPVVEQPRYKHEDLSDDELYAFDILSKVEDISDEEITELIENAKKNETLYQKTIEGLRKEYSRLQEEENMRISNEQKYEQQQRYNQFSNQILSEIDSLNSFAGQSLELSRDDVDELSQFILQLDENGVSSFGRALNDPQLFVKAAFWILNEDKIIEELNEKIKESYNRGLRDAKPKASPTVAIQPAKQKQQSLDNSIYIDDDDW